MRFLLTAAVLLVQIGVTVVTAAPVQFHLPAQPASTALLAFAKQAGAEVIFASDDLKLVQTSVVVGTYEPATALAMMLEGSGFTAKPNAAGKFVVKPDRKAPKIEPGRAAPADAENRTTTSRAAPADEAIVRLEEMVVTPSRFGIAEERLAADATLTKAELEALPQLGEDVFRTISRLPGLSTDDGSARFWVRGAPQNQLLVRLDGVDLIEPFHLQDLDGALSIVDVETIGSVDLVTGGFTAEHGDRLAGVLSMETQTDSSARRRTTLGLSVTNVRATSQGEFADGKGRWLAAARRGFIDLLLKLGGNDDVGDTPTYYDFSGKVEYRINPQHALSFHVLHSGDALDRRNEENEPDLDSRYASSYGWGRWHGDFGDRLSVESVLSYAQIDWRRDGDGSFDGIHPLTLRDDRQLTTLGLRQDWTLNLTEGALVRTGFDLKSGEADYDFTMARSRWRLDNGDLTIETLNVAAHLNPDGNYVSAYVAPRFQFTRALIAEPGIRFERHSHTGDSGWSPRLNASFALSPRTTLRAAWGIYQQAQGLHELQVGDGETTFQAGQRAEQRVVGVSHQLPSGIQLRVEAYERLNSRRESRWENLINDRNFFPEALDDRVRLPITRARARGVEIVMADHTRERFAWSATYAYGVTEERIGPRWVPRNRDQRHSLYADVTYVPAKNWRLSGSWQFHTGWPVTDITASVITLNNGLRVYQWNYGELNARRAPAYHRLDFRATRVFHLKQGTLRTYVDIFNLYARDNELGYESPTRGLGTQVIVSKRLLNTPSIRLLPSMGVSWEF